MIEEQIIQEFLKKSIRTVSKKKFNSKIEFRRQVQVFLKAIKSKLVKIELRKIEFEEEKNKQPYQNWTFTFEVIFILNDPYIDSKLYEKGSVYVFPSKKLYTDVRKKCLSMFEVIPEWNTENTVATVTGRARAY